MKKVHGTAFLFEGGLYEEMQNYRLPNEEQVDKIRARYPEGTRIRLQHMVDEPFPIQRGTMGTVIAVDDAGQLLMDWDNGRCLSLIPGVDSFDVVSRPDLSQGQPKLSL